MPVTPQAIIDNPLAFGRQYPIEIDSSGVNFGADSKTKTVATTQAHINSFEQVKGSSRVRTAGIEGDLGRCFVVLDNPTTNLVPIFYLHWAMNSVCRITLKPSSGPAPRLFFTANLNGCMVVVEGSRDCPTVYHANAAAAAPSTAGPRLNPHPLTETAAKGAIDTKVATMQQAFSDLSQTFDKRKKHNKFLGRFGRNRRPASKAVSQYDYDMLLGRGSGTGTVSFPIS